MSGVAAIFHSPGRPIDRSHLDRMARRLELHSSGGTGQFVGPSFGFAYGLPQPVCTTRGPLAIVADARIDAKDDLLQRFPAEQRESLRGATDAEWILHSYERWGERCLEHLIGDFSFAIWDSRSELLFGARDHFGVKPFFFASVDAGLAFSNNLDCLREHPQIGSELDSLAIADFLVFGYFRDTASTAFAGIRRLPAGHALRWRSGILETYRYWTLNPAQPDPRRADADCIDGFLHHLERAVSDRVHPVRTSVLMSGGLDSTMVAAMAARHSGSVASYAIVYDRLVSDPERPYAQMAADALGLPLHYLAADDYELFQPPADGPQNTPEPVDEPIPAVFHQHLKQVQSHSEVALSGVGGDSLLAASPNLAWDLLKTGRIGGLTAVLWKYMRLRHGLPPVGLRGALLRTMGLQAKSQPSMPQWLNPDLVSTLGLEERWHHAAHSHTAGIDGNGRGAYGVLTDPGWQWIFESYDPAFTGVPVDIRHPLFDLRLVNYCLTLPPIPWCVDKAMARVAMKGILPDAIRLRPKSFAADAVAPRLSGSVRIDDWEPHTDLARFVDRRRVPALAKAGGSWNPHHRPYALNQWLCKLTSSDH